MSGKKAQTKPTLIMVSKESLALGVLDKRADLKARKKHLKSVLKKFKWSNFAKRSV